MKKNKRLIISLFIAAVVICVGLYYFFSKNTLETNKLKETNIAAHPVGMVKPCAINPSFPDKYGLTPPLYIDFRQKGYRGVRIIEKQTNGKILQLPEWSNYGWLGLYTLDNKGNIYISSIPHESVEHNPIGEQNRILKIDTETGAMKEFMKLSQKKASSMRNPFGAMDLNYDCDNNFLYVSSVAGSTIKEALGSIFQIDLDRKKIISQLENTDAIGLSTFNTISGKRLFFGLARKPEIHSIALDEKGNFFGEPRFEFSLLDQPGGAYDKAHKIRFINDNMEIRANNFTFTLEAASDPEINIYRFRYNRLKDSWTFIEVHPQNQ